MRVHHKAALVVAAITLLVFLPSVTGSFVYDDVPLVSNNEYVQSWQHAGRAFRTHFWDVSLYEDAAEMRGELALRQYYRPLVTLSYLANWALADGKAWAFHLVNVLLHALAAGLAARAATRWTRSLRLGVAASLVFALHPTRTENVAWISGRTDVMMLVFVFAALEAFRAFRRRGRFAMLGVGLAAFAAAILSKEPGAMLVLLALADRETTSEGRRRERRGWIVPALTGALGMAYVAGRLVFWAPEGDVARHFTPRQFLVTLGTYVVRAIAPWPPTMYLSQDGSSALAVLGGVTLAASALAAFVAWRRARTAFWLLLAAYAVIGPLLNLQSSAATLPAQDRFLYAPLFFAVSAVAVLARAPLARIAKRRIAWLALAGALLAATFVIEIRTLDYRSNETFWQAELAHHPTNPEVLENLGTDAAARGDVAGAYDYFTRAERYGRARTMKPHFLRAVMLASLLPDGRGDDLATLLDELWRLEDPRFVPPPGSVRDYEIGTPLALTETQRVALEKTLRWDIALVASRVGDWKRTKHAADHGSKSLLYASSSPLNGALALARAGRMADARAVVETLADRRRAGRPAPAQSEIAALSNQLARAEAISDDAVRLASLGAYLAALRALSARGALDSAEAAPLVAQLLVACRLEDGARAHVSKHLGAARAAAIVAELVAQLPEPLRAIPPVENRTKEELLESLRRP